MESANVFIHGALCALAAVAALIFLKDWRGTGDRFFSFFAFAFVALGASWAALAIVGTSHEHDALIFSLRLAAFVSILVGIVDKNRRAARRARLPTTHRARAQGGDR